MAIGLLRSGFYTMVSFSLLAKVEALLTFAEYGLTCCLLTLLVLLGKATKFGPVS